MGIFGNAFGLPHLILILAIVLLLFGAPKLPGLARSIGQSMKIFRNEIRDPNKVDDSADAGTAADEATVSHTAEGTTAPAKKNSSS